MSKPNHFDANTVGAVVILGAALFAFLVGYASRSVWIGLLVFFVFASKPILTIAGRSD